MLRPGGRWVLVAVNGADIACLLTQGIVVRNQPDRIGGSRERNPSDAWELERAGTLQPGHSSLPFLILLSS